MLVFDILVVSLLHHFRMCNKIAYRQWLLSRVYGDRKVLYMMLCLMVLFLVI